MICPHNKKKEGRKESKACIPLSNAIWNRGDMWFENVFVVVLIVKAEQILNGQSSAVLLQGEQTLPHGSCNAASAVPTLSICTKMLHRIGLLRNSSHCCRVSQFICSGMLWKLGQKRNPSDFFVQERSSLFSWP